MEGQEDADVPTRLHIRVLYSSWWKSEVVIISLECIYRCPGTVPTRTQAKSMTES